MRRVVSIGDEALVVILPVDWSSARCSSGERFQRRGSTAGMLVVSPVSRTGDPDIRDVVPSCFQRSAGRSPCFTLTMRSDVPCLSFAVYSRKWRCRTADRSHGRARSNDFLALFRGRSKSGAGCRRPLKQADPRVSQRHKPPAACGRDRGWGSPPTRLASGGHALGIATRCAPAE